MFNVIDQCGVPTREENTGENDSLDAENFNEGWVPTYTNESLGYDALGKHGDPIPVEADNRNPGAPRLPQGNLPSRWLSAIFNFNRDNLS